METDISKVLSYEIKKELAERYFGFRKLIEEDKKELSKDLHFSSITVEHKIVQDLIRIYIILKEDELIRQFLELSGLDEKLFFDPYLLDSPTIRDRVFAGVKTRGLTKSGRFKNLLMDSYDMLVIHVESYREKYAELLESWEIIEAEIKLFYQKNDIGSILDFLRNIDIPDPGAASLGVVPQAGFSGSLENKMRVNAPKPIDQSLPVLPPLVPLAQIKRPLKKIAEQAETFHPDGFFLL